MKGISENFKMVAKTIYGLEEICSNELRSCLLYTSDAADE